DTDFEVGVRGDIHLRCYHRAVQPLVEKEVGAARQILPRSECADRSAVLLRFMLVVNVVARAPAAALAIVAEHFLELGQEVRFLAEMAEVVVAAQPRLDGRLLHFSAAVAMERVALDKVGRYVLAPKDVLKRLAHRGGAGARGTCDRDDGMLR